MNQEKLPTVFVSVLFDLFAEAKTEQKYCRCEGRVALGTRTSSEVEHDSHSLERREHRSGDATLTWNKDATLLFRQGTSFLQSEDAPFT